nr:AraC family transcriptional regulator ligand-binding domain-containing protein [Nocardia albiluteola]
MRAREPNASSRRSYHDQVFDSVPSYSVALAKGVLTIADDGANGLKLLRSSGLPDIVATGCHGTVSAHGYLRLWEHAEFLLDAPDVGLRGSTAYRLGMLGIFDYLFSTAETVADGFVALQAGGATTNQRLGPNPHDDCDETRTMALELIHGEGRGAELAIQAAVGGMLGRIRHATGHDLAPTRITLRQKQPRHHGRFVEAFGTQRLEFGAPIDSITLRRADLARPLRTADPALARILREHAASLPRIRLDSPAWPELVHEIIVDSLGADDITLAAVAHRLAVSPRTLQRRLAEADTTWRGEIDRARQALAERVIHDHHNRSILARRLGYSDTRALRRATRRWQAQAPAPSVVN